jgi:hypothetical protein
MTASARSPSISFLYFIDTARSYGASLRDRKNFLIALHHLVVSIWIRDLELI